MPDTGSRLPAAPPLPMRDGIAASRVYLPRGPWKTLGEFLPGRFPHVPAEIIARRLAQGEIVDGTGVAQRADSAYRAGMWLWYYREVPDESVLPFDLPILHQDARLVVVDKPHFMASTPGGRHLRETALTRLRRLLALPDLTPLHRLDRETAGVLMFCADPAARGAYQSLFQARAVVKEYEALAPLPGGLALPLTRRSRLEDVRGCFVVREAPGAPNSETRIELMGLDGCPDGMARYRLLPLTGRKHQLRAHMSALGLPIVNDGLYPRRQAATAPDDFRQPLQLLARAIAFRDPFLGIMRRFESTRSLRLSQ
ncbi:pseudouridine synthase [Allopusillimonas soli]|uniref:Pseudouridine synthase n=1 Tax=Allopusillimonas soli TaxID=659016 RepID=A0A853FGC1_9BURK|nr:pseudouridine synthase [Allopusillimonas soli]NYT37521.1 pseudouridine synthase [Allopusillimonas soli]TEA74505.1 pseudouridine synthase [Allopusillimonas soli]